MRNILLHACCGPCAVYPIQYFKESNCHVSAYYYNPNIHPHTEHIKRGEGLKEVCSRLEVDLIYSDDFMQEHWIAFSGTKEERCAFCYELRLKQTAAMAASMNCDGFSTSLLISPYQKHDLIVYLCKKFSDEYKIEFVYKDFRSFFREGQRMAKEMGIYRQKYCGCICSLNESDG